MAGQASSAFIQPGRSRNRLIAAIPSQEFVQLRPHLKTVPLVTKQVLHKHGDAVREVYFPAGGACSLMTNTDGRLGGEIAAIGNEGLVGANVFFGERVAAGDAVVTVGETEAYMMDVEAFTHAMLRRGGFHNLVVRYSQAVVGQIMQLTVCNRLHSADARACRWLLNARDRVGRDQFPLSYALFADVLDVPPTTIARTIGALVHAGAIDFGRGHVHIVDRAWLQSSSCECYAIIGHMFARLLPELFNSRTT